MAANQVSSRVEGIVTKDGVRNFGSNGHGFTLVPYSGTEKAKDGAEKGDARPAVFFDVAFFGNLPDGVAAGARVAVDGYVFKTKFVRRDGAQGEAPNVKAFEVEVLDPNVQTNVTLVGRVGKDGVKAIGDGKVFVMMPYSGKDKEGKFLPSLFVEVKCFGVETVDVTAGVNVKVSGTMYLRKYTRGDGTPGSSYELMAKTVQVTEAARAPAASTAGADSAGASGSGLDYEDEPPLF